MKKTIYHHLAIKSELFASFEKERMIVQKTNRAIRSQSDFLDMIFNEWLKKKEEEMKNVQSNDLQ